MQRKFVVPPSGNDKDLKDFSSSVQQNLREIFENLHIHRVLKEAPTAEEGSIGEIALVTLESTTYLYAKFPLGWKRILLS